MVNVNVKKINNLEMGNVLINVQVSRLWIRKEIVINVDKMKKLLIMHVCVKRVMT